MFRKIINNSAQRLGSLSLSGCLLFIRWRQDTKWCTKRLPRAFMRFVSMSDLLLPLSTGFACIKHPVCFICILKTKCVWCVCVCDDEIPKATRIICKYGARIANSVYEHTNCSMPHANTCFPNANSRMATNGARMILSVCHFISLCSIETTVIAIVWSLVVTQSILWTDLFLFQFSI